MGLETLQSRLVNKDIWKQRFQDIRNFERYLTRNGILVRKFFLNVSKAGHTRMHKLSTDSQSAYARGPEHHSPADRSAG
jgi:polyphosphate kinase 2 (PPK2 family)